jgi:hypothetical protein
MPPSEKGFNTPCNHPAVLLYPVLDLERVLVSAALVLEPLAMVTVQHLMLRHVSVSYREHVRGGDGTYCLPLVPSHILVQ